MKVQIRSTWNKKSFRNNCCNYNILLFLSIFEHFFCEYTFSNLDLSKTLTHEKFGPTSNCRNLRRSCLCI